MSHPLSLERCMLDIVLVLICVLSSQVLFVNTNTHELYVYSIQYIFSADLFYILVLSLNRVLYTNLAFYIVLVLCTCFLVLRTAAQLV